jgi:FtsP/CotA-like multicopper oxidase with cupredoxin domain
MVRDTSVRASSLEVVARDGETITPSARFLSDTVNVGPGQRYDVIGKPRQPGKWLIHCHIPHHTSNNDAERKGGGGVMVIIDVTPP